MTAKGECHGAASASEFGQGADSYQKGRAILSDKASHLRHTPGSICSARCDELDQACSQEQRSVASRFTTTFAHRCFEKLDPLCMGSRLENGCRWSCPPQTLPSTPSAGARRRFQVDQTHAWILGGRLSASPGPSIHEARTYPGSATDEGDR